MWEGTGGVNKDDDILHLGVFRSDECHMCQINWREFWTCLVFIYTSTIMQNSLPGDLNRIIFQILGIDMNEPPSTRVYTRPALTSRLTPLL